MLSPHSMFHVPAAMLIALLAVAGMVRADIVTMSDGRVFEGEIIVEDEATVKIDTVVMNIRTTISLPRAGVTDIERKPVRQGFFQPPPPPERVSDPSQFDLDDTLYIEVPIEGRFGEQIFSRGIAACLSYAKRHRIGHIVFTINSTGGDLDEARRTYRLLERNAGSVTLHALISTCLDGALAVPIWCDTVSVRPGAQVGGSNESIESYTADPDSATAREARIVRAQIASEVAGKAKERGRGGDIIRAMIDPAQQLAGWKDEDGKLVTGAAPPDDLENKRLIFQVDSNELLQLDYNQSVAVGLPSFGGDAAALGDALGYHDWTRESDYGISTMNGLAAREARREQVAQAKYERGVQRNISRRDTTERYIAQSLEQAAQWDPAKGDYSSYANEWKGRRGWGWRGGWSSSGSGTWTQDSRNIWRDRTDAAMKYLRQTANGIRSMQKLDREAVELGLEPTFEPGRLDWMLQDVGTKFNYLQQNRNRQSQ